LKLTYKSIEKDNFRSIYINRIQEPHRGGNWHFHEEFELIYTAYGQGIRIVGDNLSHFKAPELALVGPKMPHLWKNTEDYTGDYTVDIIVVKFSWYIGNQELFAIPEFQSIYNLLKKSLNGIVFGSKIIDSVHDLMMGLISKTGPDKIIQFLTILKVLAETKEYRILSDTEFTISTSTPGEERLSTVINYISQNFTREIALEELAEKASMTPNALCRFFKNRTNLTISQFINKFRVGKACQLLINNNLSITGVCFESGFNSLTSFNRIFKKYKNITPKSYRDKYQMLNK